MISNEKQEEKSIAGQNVRHETAAFYGFLPLSSGGKTSTVFSHRTIVRNNDDARTIVQNVSTLASSFVIPP
jgi:hypothetical protein